MANLNPLTPSQSGPKVWDFAILGFALTVSLLVGGSILAYWNIKSLMRSDRIVAHTHIVQRELETMLSALKDAETGQRGYLLVTEDRYLEPYDVAVKAVAACLTRLKRLTADNPAQQARVAALGPRIDERLDELKRTVDLMRAGNRSAALAIVGDGSGKRMMDGLRQEIAAIQDSEQDLLTQRAADAANQYRVVQWTIGGSAVVGVAMVGVVFFLDQSNRRGQRRSAAIVADQRERLRTTLASIGDGVISTDSEGRITALNAVAQSLTGWTLSDALNQPLETVFRIVNEDTRETVENPVTRALREGVIVGLANHTILIARDGAERAIDDSAAPIRNEAGAVGGAVLVFRDVSDHRKVEREMASERRLLNAVLDALPVGVIIAEPSGKLVRMNRANGLLWGEAPASNTIDEYREWVGYWPATGKRVQSHEWAMARALMKNEFVPGELVEIERFDGGGRRMIINTAAPVRDEQGAIVAGVIAQLDVTDRVRVEQALRRSEERLRAGTELAGLGIVQIDYAADVAVPDPIAAVIFGLEAGVAVPRSRIHELIHPEDREEMLARLDQVMKRSGNHEFMAEHRVLLPDGSVKWLSVKKVVRFEESEGDGELRPITALLAATDVTARREAVEKLKASEERFRTLIEQVQEYAIFGIDVDGLATTWNEGVRRVLGYSEAEFIGQDIEAITCAPDESHSQENARRDLEAAAAQGSVSEDRWVKRKDGSKFWASGIVTARRDAEGRLIGFTKVMRDMTTQKELEDALRKLAADLSEADRRKDEFLATLAHELRNPLAPIRNGLQAMRLANENRELVEKARGIMERQLAHMVRLVDDLLDMSRISRGKITLQKSRADLMMVVNAAVETSRPLIEAGSHTLSLDVPSAPIYADVDVTRMAQVFANLLNNSAKYTERGGRIALTVELQGDEAVTTVRDNGVGIPPAMLPKVFQLFTQVDRSLERAQGGLGIGLSLVKRLVEMHGGSVEARSEGQGLGSEFLVRLPVVPREAVNETASDHPEDHPRPATPRRILVADDNVDSAESLAALLTIMGNEVVAVHDGLAALTAGEEFHPDVVLLDIGMPKLNGYETSMRIRQRPWGERATVIALTGWGQEEDRRQSQKAGFDHHLVKPVDPAALEKLLAASVPKS